MHFLTEYDNLLNNVKSYGGEATDFYDKEMFKAGSNHICLEGITIDSALQKDENYYLEVFLKECKYIEKETYYWSPINLFLWFWWRID